MARILATYGRYGNALSQPRLSRLANAVIEDHAPLGHHSEVAWGLWICKEMGLMRSDGNVARVCEMHSSVCALLLLDLEQLGRLPKPAKLGYWRTFESSDALHGDLWLLSYEAGVRGWAGFSDAHVRSDAHFDLLWQRDVRFYDSGASLAPLFHVMPEAIQQFQAASEVDFFDRSDVEDFSDLVDFEEDDSGYEGGVPATSEEFDDLTQDDDSAPAVDEYQG